MSTRLVPRHHLEVIVRRGSRLRGKPIVSADSGEKLGTISDLLLDEHGNRLVGVVVRHGWLANEHVLPYDSIRTLGRDAVIASSDGKLVSAREWKERRVAAVRSRMLKDKPIVTVEGRHLGSVSDVYLDELTGRLTGYELARSAMAGLITRYSVLPVTDDVHIGPDAVVVPASLAERLNIDTPAEHRDRHD